MIKVYWPFTAFILALCSLSYEFIMIKTLTSTIGGRVFNYNLVVSVFTFSLGLGSLYSDRVSPLNLTRYLGKVEVLLACVGILGPIALLAFPNLFLGIIFSSAIGILSGLELPLIFKISKEEEPKIIAYDFLGMFLASILIPLCLFKKIGLFPTAFIIGGLNLGVAFQLLEIRKVAILTTFILSVSLGCFHYEVNQVFRELFLWGALK